MSSITNLKKKLNKLETKATELQLESANQLFDLQLDDTGTVSRIMNYIDKDYTWTSKNAAMAVYVYDRLKAEKKRVTAEVENESTSVTIQLKGTELTGLYNILLNIDGSGIEKARSFTRLLTNIGEQVGQAMQALATKNEGIRDIHEEMQSLEAQIAQAEYEAQTANTVTNEASQQIKEETTNS